VVEVFWTQTDTRAGSNDTHVKLLAAMPTGTPSSNAQTAVTPLGKHP
jgi:hypothetical protein